ncbi:4,5-DOPA dioxygenase extradiol [Novosphingobium flavum]|uniref:4,5-DOPA dioxygenase extradiol n=1 Tax=Novosphingobium flavum TaxID=1778672 RepID=A0A7X1KKN2_9SPHN|nr:4,5-DOPA dioxygenase extradiol [Novosphingobium flavum]MBC2664721.1 4,5-DOPA dioxygenase extradiol [Novosphingobium flavum]
MSQRLPVLFVGHGSPMTVITDGPERRALAELGKALPRPRAVLCVSAHWETQGRTHVTAAGHPRTIHDFYGFPQALFDWRYPAQSPEWMVERVSALIGEDRVLRDDAWGYDHGTWGVLDLLFPGEYLPTVAMSLDRTLGPEAHLALAEKLAPLRDEGVLIVASGNVIHNLALWRQAKGTQPDWAVEFRERINRAVTADDRGALTRFPVDDQAAAYAINSAEHYLPLLYAVGAREAGDEVTTFNDTLDGALSMTSYLLGDPAALAAVQ